MRLALPASALTARLACLLVVALASACEPVGPTSAQPLSSTAQLTLQTSDASLPADFFSVAVVSATVTSTSGPAPTGRVFLSTNKGRFVGSRVGSSGQVVVVDLFTSNLGSAQVQCVSPEGTAVVGTMTITATFTSGDNTGELVSNPVSVRCTSAMDLSSVTFSGPRDGETLDVPTFQDFLLGLRDFHGGPLQAPARVHVVSLDGVELQVAAPDSNRRFMATTADVPVMGGDATFWMQRPRDAATRDASIPFRLQVSFTNSGGVTSTVTGSFTWGPSGVPDATGARITHVATASTDVAVHQGFPAQVLVHAGLQDAWMEFRVDVVDVDGLPWGMEQDVTITCIPEEPNAVAATENCKALTGRDPAPGGVLQLEHASQVVVTAVPTTAFPTGPRTQALVMYRVPVTSVPGTVRLAASFVLPSGETVTNDLAETAVVSLVDENSLTVWREVVQLPDPPLTHQVTLQAFDGLQPARGFLVCALLDDVGTAFAFLDDRRDDQGGSALVMPVESEGVASFLVRPRPASTPVLVRVDFAVARVPYTAELDDNALTNQRDVCANLAGATVVTGSETFQLLGQ